MIRHAPMLTSTVAAVTAVLALAYVSLSSPVARPADAGHRNAEYVVAGVSIRLVDGTSVMEQAPGSGSKLVTRVFGNELTHDLDGDGAEDIIFLLTQESGGSGLFYYVVAALTRPEGPVGSHGLYIGDRIAPQPMSIEEPGILVVNYADRAPAESFAVAPSQARSMRLRFDPETLDFGEIVEEAQGEADPARMTLTMQRWTWISTRLGDGAQERPHQKMAFALEFLDDGRFTATTDCNRVSGRYVTAHDQGISFRELTATRMFCDGSQEATFVRALAETTGHRFTTRGELVLTSDAGMLMTFR